jgi:NADH:ubiquinone reductase (non-electrogenic)
MVLALGAESKLDVVPGAIEFAIPFSTLEDARVSAMKDGSII